MTQPDWEGFARAIMDAWPEGDVDGGDLQETAERYGLLRKEPYDPAKHGEWGKEEYGTQPGEDWYVLTYAEERPELDFTEAVQNERERLATFVNGLLRSTDSTEDVGWNNAVIQISRELDKRGLVYTAEDIRRAERERIARMFEDLYPDWAAIIRYNKKEA